MINLFNTQIEANNLDDEVWKDIPGHEGVYQASTLGRIKAYSKCINHFRGGKRKIAEKILKGHVNKRGYKIVTLHKDGELFSRKVHRLIAITHIPNPENKPEVNHMKNELGIVDKTDNRVLVLEWSTSKENIQDSWKNGLSKYSEKARKAVSEICKKRVGSKNPVSKLTEKEVLEIRRIGGSISQSKIAEKYSINQQTVSKIINNKRWTHL